MTQLTKSQRALIEETIKATFLAQGIDITDPEEVLRMQQDRHFVRASRLRSQGLQDKAFHHVIIMILQALGAAALLGLAHTLGFTRT